MDIARVAAIGLLAATAGCKPIEDAPEDMAEAIDRAWTALPSEDPDALASLLLSFDAFIDEEALSEGSVDGEQNRMDAAAQALVELHAPPDDDGSWTLPDVTLARPFFLVNRFACASDDLVAILTEPDQDSLYEAYETYERTYFGDIQPFLDGEDDALSWSGQLVGDIPLAGVYTYDFRTDLRRVVVPEGHPSAGAEAYLVRAWIPFPSVFDGGNKTFPQDYQLEMFVPVGDDVVHVYAIWREMDLGALGTMESDAVARVVLNSLVSWDRKTSELCETGSD